LIEVQALDLGYLPCLQNSKHRNALNLVDFTVIVEQIEAAILLSLLNVLTQQKSGYPYYFA
jgi:hypothetical protein